MLDLTAPQPVSSQHPMENDDDYSHEMEPGLDVVADDDDDADDD